MTAEKEVGRLQCQWRAGNEATYHQAPALAPIHWVGVRPLDSNDDFREIFRSESRQSCELIQGAVALAFDAMAAKRWAKPVEVAILSIATPKKPEIEP